MGLDVGTRTVGLAISDRTRTIASPLVTVHRKKFGADAAAIAARIAERGASALIYGLPVNMDGSEGPRCQSVRQFARNLDAMIALPYAFWDERLSTAAVERLLIGEADMTRKRPRRGCRQDGRGLDSAGRAGRSQGPAAAGPGLRTRRRRSPCPTHSPQSPPSSP